MSETTKTKIKCHFCDKEADGQAVGNIPICMDCLFEDGGEYDKYLKEKYPFMVTELLKPGWDK